MLTRINLSTHSLIPTSQKRWNEKDVHSVGKSQITSCREACINNVSWEGLERRHLPPLPRLMTVLLATPRYWFFPEDALI